MFKWDVAEKLVTETTWRRLQAVEALRCGQTEAPETEAVTPVSIEVVPSLPYGAGICLAFLSTAAIFVTVSL